LDIAVSDIDAARRSLVPDPEPNIPAAAYHCQQAVEKLMKALLVHLALPYARGSGGHDLRRLVAALPATHPLLNDALALVPISPWATAFRYPADDPYTAEPLPQASEVQHTLEKIGDLYKRVTLELGPLPSSGP
jgi:HEPN domain-containing protein